MPYCAPKFTYPRFSEIKEVECPDEMLLRYCSVHKIDTDICPYKFSLKNDSKHNIGDFITKIELTDCNGLTCNAVKCNFFLGSPLFSRQGEYVIDDTRLYEALECLPFSYSPADKVHFYGYHSYSHCILIKVLGFKCHKIGTSETAFVRISDLKSISVRPSWNEAPINKGIFPKERKLDFITSIIKKGGAFKILHWCNPNNRSPRRHVYTYAEYMTPEEVARIESKLKAEELRCQREKQIREEQEALKKKEEKKKNQLIEDYKNDNLREFRNIEYISYKYDDNDIIEANSVLTTLAGNAFNRRGFTTIEGDYKQNGVNVFGYILDVDTQYEEYISEIFKDSMDIFVSELKTWIGVNHNKNTIRYILYGRFKKYLSIRFKKCFKKHRNKTVINENESNLFDFLTKASRWSPSAFVGVLNVIADVAEDLYNSGNYHDRYLTMSRLRYL